MKSNECARAIQPGINKLGSGFMMDGATFGRASEVGLDPGLGFYILGRFGVLGRVNADVIAAAAGFFAPAGLKAMWDDAASKADPSHAAAVFMECADSWGQRNLANAANLAELNAIAAKVVDNATPVAASLFAGLRGMDRTDNPAGLLTQLSFCLRELRMARHVVAVMADGMAPVEAIMSGGGGEANAKMFGWQPPFPDVSALADRRVAVEEATHAIHARDLDVLSDAERATFASGIAAVFASLG